jgi:hypothetical protein
MQMIEIDGPYVDDLCLWYDAECGADGRGGSVCLADACRVGTASSRRAVTLKHNRNRD